MFNPEDIDTRVIDQRIGVGIGGLDTVIRLLHKPTGIIIEMPKLHRSQYHDREIANLGLYAMLEELKNANKTRK